MNSRPNIVRIAAAQYPLDRYDSLDDYRTKLARWVAEAAADGAALLVFPEYGAMEYAGCDPRSAGDLAASLAVASDAMAAMQDAHVRLAQRYGVHILASSGPCRQVDGSYVNRAKLFAPSGVYGWQDKLIMTPFETAWGISAGTSVRVFDTSLGSLGVAICYDSEFPLVVRCMCEAGADIILIPSCTEYVSGYNRVRTAARARALENGCVTVHASTIGDAIWSPAIDHNYGAAGLCVPAEHGLSDTGVLASGAPNIPVWVSATIDIERLRNLRSTGEMRNARDWCRQPGAHQLCQTAERISLI